MNLSRKCNSLKYNCFIANKNKISKDLAAKNLKKKEGREVAQLIKPYKHED